MDHFNLHGEVDIQVGTLSKAIGGLGGYIAGPQKLIDYLVQRARPFLFSTSHPPGVIAAASEAIDMLQEQPELIDKLWENTDFFRQGLQNLGFDTGNSETPIIPVIVGDERKTMILRIGCLRRVYLPKVSRSPRSRGARPGCAPSSRQPIPQADLQYALDAFAKVGRELGLI